MRKTNHFYAILLPVAFVVIGVATLFQISSVEAEVSAAPVINVWYGLNQTFGQNGIPQQWVNILGNITMAGGTIPSNGIALTYALNGGGEQPLSVGPDTRRLVQPGDFNIEIDYASLEPGNNQVVITAVDSSNNHTSQTVNVNYIPAQTLPLPYTLDWSTIATITQGAQIVDGRWNLESVSGGKMVRPAILGYDRVIDIGDMVNWKDYEITVPVVIHGYPPDAKDLDSGVGLIVRWQGHNQQDGPEQPSHGYVRHGAFGWYSWYGRLALDGNVVHKNTNTIDRELKKEVTYIWKLRAVTAPDNQRQYHFRVWDASQPEPQTWDLFDQGTDQSTLNGSVLLIAHHTDVSFGNVSVKPVSAADKTPHVSITKTGNGVVMVTPDPTQFPNGYPYGTLVTIITKADPGWIFAGWNSDQTGKNNLGGFPSIIQSFPLTQDIISMAVFEQDASGIKSDDFNSCQLNQNLWTFVNPLNDATLSFSGKQAVISVPGTTHDAWTGGILTPRLRQAVQNTDFDVEAKFDSKVNEKYQLQGILAERDDTNFVRFDIHSTVTGTISSTILYAVAIENGSPLPANQKIIGDSTHPFNPPYYLRVQRIGNVWNEYYSQDGQNWLPGFVLTHTIQVGAVSGFTVGNVGADGKSAPPFTSVIDYFFNRAAPIAPEDAVTHTILAILNPAGQGTVSLSSPSDPNFGGYKCGEQVTLTANPAPGFKFVNWSGAASGNNRMTTVTITGGIQAVTANFAPENHDQQLKLYLPIVIK